MSEEWTEVEVDGERFRFLRDGDTSWVETQDAEGQWWVPNQALFRAGMEAACQEMRETLQEAWDRKLATIESKEPDDPEEEAYWHGVMYGISTLGGVVESLSPPDSETES